MGKYIVDIHGEIEGDYEIIGKYQEPKTGHWILDDFTGLIKCDICGNDAYIDTTSGEQCKSKYCPNCGAKMESEG